MKKVFLLIICAVLSIGAQAQFSGSGTGTESDPYRIYNPDQLNQIRNFSGQMKVFSIEADIDLAEWIEDNNPTQGWSPITNFESTIKGNNHTISNLWIKRPTTDYIGFVGRANYGTIEDLIFENAHVEGKGNCGIVSGSFVYGRMSNVKVNNSEVIGNGNKVGTIAGYSDLGSSSELIANNCTITGKGNYTGGLVGYDDRTEIYQSGVLNSRIISIGECAGGIVGYAGTEISYSYFYGFVYGKHYVGGIVGKAPTSSVKSSFAVAEIHGTGNSVGGIAGESSVYDSYFSGKVSGGSNVGGVTGVGKVSKCYSMSERIYGLSSYIAGISNRNTNYSVEINKEITGMSGVCRIGLSGSNNKAWVKTKLFENGVEKIVEDSEKHGTSVSLATLKYQATYQALGWDFTSEWTIQDTECFPYKQTQTAPPYFTEDKVTGETRLSGKCIEDGEVTITIGGKTYTATSVGHDWSVAVDPLKTGDEIKMMAWAKDKLPSYAVYATVMPLGKGTEADPYRVFSAEDLQVIKMNSSDYYKLMNDIDLTNWINKNSPTEGWNPIGSTAAVLMASFDGDGHTISGLWTNSTADNVGLFAKSNGSTIKNLTVKIASGKKLIGAKNVGVIVAVNNGTIKNCQVIGDVSATGNAGGIAGTNTGAIVSCNYNGNIASSAAGNIGGIAGENNGSISMSCTVGGSVVSSGTGVKAGGLVGKSSGSVENCYSTVPVTSKATDTEVYAAGLVGYNEGSVVNCYASGDVESGYKGCGVVGYNSGENATIAGCIGLNQNVSAKNSAFRIVGGFGNGAPSPGNDNKAMKSMVLSVNGVPMKIYDDPLNGYAIADEATKQMATYTGLSWVADIWTIAEGSSYPTLVNNDIKVPSDPDSGAGDGGDVKPSEPDTNIAFLSNVIYANSLDGNKGQDVELSIRLKNSTVDVTAFSFNLVLPEGFSVKKVARGTRVKVLDDNDEYVFTFASSDKSGTRYVQAYNMSGAVLDGKDGEIAKITISMPENITASDYPIVITEGEISYGSSYVLNDRVKSTLTVKDYIVGDANGDGRVSITDESTIAGYLLGSTPEGFSAAGADANGDGRISITDVSTLASQLLAQ